jgi:tRNA(Ile)-lysidine synthase
MMRHRHPFVKAIVDRLADPCVLAPGDRLIIACSGGADSVALALALAAIHDRQPWAFELHLAHIDHQLRGTSAADAVFVESLASDLNLPCHVRRVACEPTEASAREARYAALIEIAREIDADAIATAHHADDQLETMLMRLVRGTSVTGLAGIDPRNLIDGVPVVRPMLGVTHEQSTAFCRVSGWDWREDETNAQADRWRNVLRLEALPTLHELRADASTKASEAADALREVRDALDWMIDRIDTTDRTELAQLPVALLGGVIRKRCVAAGVSADRLGGDTLRPILDAIRDGSGESRTFDLAGGAVVNVSVNGVNCVSRKGRKGAKARS